MNLIQVIEQFKGENASLSQIISNSKEESLQVTLEQLSNQLKGSEFQLHKSEEKNIILLNELRLKQEDYEKLHVFTEHLRK